MAWEDVPAKLEEYGAMAYAPENAVAALLSAFGAADTKDVASQLREEFEAHLAYRMGACENLENSKAIHPRDLT